MEKSLTSLCIINRYFISDLDEIILDYLTQYVRHDVDLLPFMLHNGEKLIHTYTLFNGKKYGKEVKLINNILMYDCEYREGVKHGVEHKYENYSIYHLSEENQYIDDKKHGLCKQFDITGGINIYHYVNGKKHGKQENYYKGLLIFECEYKDDKLNGIMRTFDFATVHENNREINKLIDEIPYLDGKKHGTYKKWNIYTNKLIIEIDYKMGKKHGRFIKYYDCGQPKIEMRYNDDMLVNTMKTWHLNGVLKSELHFHAGLPHGIKRKWDTDGKLITSILYMHGVKKEKQNHKSKKQNHKSKKQRRKKR